LQHLGIMTKEGRRTIFIYQDFLIFHYSSSQFKARTLQCMRLSAFNTTYETVAMRGVSGGLDTRNITEIGSFHFCSQSTETNACFTIWRCADIKALVNMLVAEEVLNTNLARAFLF
jgi:hypothetical protein